jgi:hypothetical protein
MGMLGLASAYPTNFIWLANPLLFASWLAMLQRVRLPAIACSVLALGLGFAFLLATKVMVSESGTPNRVEGYGVGYWLWLASIAIACCASLLVRSAKATTSTKEAK